MTPYARRTRTESFRSAKSRGLPFADESRRVLGIITRWHGQEEYGLIVLGPDEHGKWRAIGMASEYPSLDAAARELIQRMEEVSTSGQTVFPKGVEGDLQRSVVLWSPESHTVSTRPGRSMTGAPRRVLSAGLDAAGITGGACGLLSMVTTHSQYRSTILEP